MKISHYLPRSLVFLAVTEVIILLTSFYAGLQVYQSAIASGSSPWSIPLLLKAFLFTAFFFGALAVTGLYWQYQRNKLVSTLVRILVSFIIGILGLTIVFHAFPVLALPSEALIAAVRIGLTGIVLAHVSHYMASNVSSFKPRILVLGTGRVAHQLEKLAPDAVEIVGYVPMSGQTDGEIQHSLREIRANQSILDLARELEVEQIVVALDDQRKATPINELLECKLGGLRITDASTFIENCLRKIDLETLTPSKIFYSDGFRVSPLKKIEKRLIDVTVSLFVLTLVWPVMALAALAIFIESRGSGPLFYQQVRVGQRGKLYTVLKFRSMHVGAEQNGVAQYAEEDDPRVTRVGRVLRKMRIDELPQLINVLRGDMSFVGPRPERPEFVQQYLTNIPYYGLRHEIKPGITGWAQICYPYGSSEQDAVEKLKYDLYYVKHYSLFLDINIFFQTVHTVVLGRGAR